MTLALCAISVYFIQCCCFGHTFGGGEKAPTNTVGIGVKSDPENGPFMFGFEQIFLMFSLLVYCSKIFGNIDWEILGGR